MTSSFVVTFVVALPRPPLCLPSTHTLPNSAACEWPPGRTPRLGARRRAWRARRATGRSRPRRGIPAGNSEQYFVGDGKHWQALQHCPGGTVVASVIYLPESRSMAGASLRFTQRDRASPLYGSPRCRSARCRVTGPTQCVLQPPSFEMRSKVASSRDEGASTTCLADVRRRQRRSGQGYLVGDTKFASRRHEFAFFSNRTRCTRSAAEIV